tara:strand:+ start:797 stop:997 length:201 start_codon:yes stop_codon:yes gene_type:complete
MSKGLLLEIGITDLVCDKLSDSNKIISNNLKNSSNPAILIQINNKLISHVKLPSSDWDEDAMNLSM